MIETVPIRISQRNSEVKPVRLDDDTERYSGSRIKTLNYAYHTQLVRMVKVIRCRRPEALANNLANMYDINFYSLVSLKST